MFYQCFKTRDRQVYCSSGRFKNHDEGASWVAACMQHFGIRASDMLGKPYEADKPPPNAVIY